MCVCVCVGGGGNGEGGRRVGRKRRGEGTGCDVCCTLYTVPKAPGADDASLPEFRLLDKAQFGQVRLERWSASQAAATTSSSSPLG